MSTLPADEVDGTTLPAGFLNQQLAARFGDITPVDPITRTASDNSHDNGTAVARWKDGFFGGNIKADGQFRARIRTTVTHDDSFGGGVEPIVFGTEDFDIGGLADLGADNDRLTASQDGVYLVTMQFLGTGSGLWVLFHKDSGDVQLDLFAIQIIMPASSNQQFITSFPLVMSTGDYINGELNKQDTHLSGAITAIAGTTMALTKLS